MSKKKQNNKQSIIGKIILYAFAVLFIFTVVSFMRTPTSSYVTGQPHIYVHFWKFSLIVSSVLGVFGGLWLMKHAGNIQKNKTKSFFGYFFLIVLMTFFTIEFGADFINRTFDRSEPEIYEAMIIEKEYNGHKKSADDHIFEVKIEGKDVDIYVSYSTYKKYLEGDYINIYRYKGALGHEYYTVYKK